MVSFTGLISPNDIFRVAALLVACRWRWKHLDYVSLYDPKHMCPTVAIVAEHCSIGGSIISRLDDGAFAGFIYKLLVFS